MYYWLLTPKPNLEGRTKQPEEVGAAIVLLYRVQQRGYFLLRFHAFSVKPVSSLNLLKAPHLESLSKESCSLKKICLCSVVEKQKLIQEQNLRATQRQAFANQRGNRLVRIIIIIRIIIIANRQLRHCQIIITFSNIINGIIIIKLNKL